METKDFTDASGQQVDRLTAVKQVLDDFLARRKGERVGLIFFGSAAFVQAPFTEDLDALRSLLDEAQVRMAGPKTAFGDAIGLALDVFAHDEGVRDRVLVVLTDGNDTGSQVPPRKAAEIARDRKVTIHTVAVGDPTAAGEDKLDEETLQAVAATTGGRYSHAGDREALAHIYDDLDELRTREAETISHRPRLDLFYWPLGAALLLSLAYHLAWAIRAAARSRSAVLAATAPALRGAAVFGQLHFLRPWWLIALIPALALFWAIRRQQDIARPWRGVIAENLLPYLLSGGERQRRLRPELLLLAGWVVSTLAVAGPTWRREPSPFAEDEAALVIALEVTPTMRAQDVQPSRLERAAQKIRDIIERRRGTRSALVAYAGSAHLVMPLTRDGELVARFASELSPEVMPREGNSLSEALALADEQRRRSGLPGSILVLADAVPPEELPRLTAWRKSSDAPVQLLAVAAGPDAPVRAGGPPAPALDRAALERAAHELDASLTVVSPDDSDVRWLARHVRTRMVAAAGAQEAGERWQDAGYWLVWAVAVLSLMWFRPGWAVQWQ
jgi:Mg-chelatase subunit ChlD